MAAAVVLGLLGVACSGTPAANDARASDGPGGPGDGGPQIEAYVERCGLYLSDCRANEVCDIKSCAKGGSGLCVPKPISCPKVLAEVCGCDGQTYANDCARLMTGVSLRHAGACPLGDGGSRWPDGGPQDSGAPPTCGGPSAVACATGSYCERTGCAKTAPGVCLKLPKTGCPIVIATVCGCDGRSYLNDCSRRHAGVALLHPGACLGTFCFGYCACPQGLMCVNDGGGSACWANKMPVYCCTNPGCPSGERCFYQNHQVSTCP